MKKNTTQNRSCLNTPFRITTLLSDSGPINETASLADGSLEYSAESETFEGNLEVVECRGLCELQKWLDTGDPEFAVLLGYPQQNGQSIQSVDVKGPRPSKSSSSPKIQQSPHNLMQFSRNEFLLIVFDVPCTGNSIETAWEHLCAVDPQLSDVGHLAFHSPYSHIRDATTGQMLTVENGYRFCCLAKKSSNIKKYREIFSKLSWIRGYGHLELSGSGNYLIKQIVDSEAFTPGYTLCNGIELGQGLIQERPGSTLRAGGLLDTRILKSLDDIDEYAYMLAVKEAKASLRDLHDQMKGHWLDRRSFEIAKTTGCSEDEAAHAAQSVANEHILPDIYTLNFELYGWVTVAELLADPIKYHRAWLTDPIACHDEQYVAVFEWYSSEPLVRCPAFRGRKYRFSDAQVTKAKRQLSARIAQSKPRFKMKPKATSYNPYLVFEPECDEWIHLTVKRAELR